MCWEHCVFNWASFVDWFSIISAITTAAAAVLAGLAIWQSSQQSKRNAELIARERRIEFQLEMLKELLDLVNQVHGGMDRNLERWRGAHARLRMIDAELPVTRIRFTHFPDNKLLGEALGLDYDGDNPDDQPRVADGKVIRNLMFDETRDAMTALAFQLPPA